MICSSLDARPNSKVHSVELGRIAIHSSSAVGYRENMPTSYRQTITFVLLLLCLSGLPCCAMEADACDISTKIDPKQKQFLITEKFRTITSPGRLPDSVKKYYAGTGDIESVLAPNYKKWWHGPCGFGQEGRARRRFVTAASSPHQCAVLYQTWNWPDTHWDLFDISGFEARLVSDSSRRADVPLCTGATLMQSIRYQCSHPQKFETLMGGSNSHRTTSSKKVHRKPLGFNPGSQSGHDRRVLQFSQKFC